jgi:beta-glucosidase
MHDEDRIARMTLEEKCLLLSGGGTFTTRALPRLGIPSLQLSDGPHGLRLQREESGGLGLGGSVPATCFPTATTVANSWDPALGERLGRALGEEALAQGVDVVLGPGLCVKRSPLCGRGFEYFSEDPLLAGRMAAGYVRGIQSTGVAACPKHFACNSQETRRQASDSVLDERTLREIYLSGFETVVRVGRPRCIMSSYNLVNGTYANESRHLLRDVLRDEWGFEGAVVSDWGGSNDRAAGVAAGSTLEMPGPGLCSARELAAAVRRGEVSEADVDARVDEALGLALSAPGGRTTRVGFDADAHHRLAREIAAQSIVLLKNDPPAGGGGQAGAPLLPLAAGTSVALVGDFAKTPRYQGAGSSRVVCTRLDSLCGLVGDSDLDCVGYAQGFERHGAASDRLAAEAVALSARADVVLVCLGLDERAESEGADRPDMRVNGNQLDLLSHVAEANPNVVVLLSGGGPVESGWMADARAVLYLALGGQAGAAAALDVLLGRVNPSGRLNETWPVALADTPCARTFPSPAATAEYREGPYVGYRYYQTAGIPVALPFGFGLSYTTFAYSDLAVSEDEASFSIANVGPVAGSEVAQLYVSKPCHEVFRPERELRGFAKVALGPGEGRRVSIPLGQAAFRYWNVGTSSWEVEGGTYVVRIGASVDDIRLSGEIDLAGTGAPNPYEGLDLGPYETGRVADVDDARFAALLGHEIPSSRIRLDRNLCICDLIHGRSPLLWLLWAVMLLVKCCAEASGKPRPELLFAWNMPLRALAKNASGVFSMGAVDGLVMEVRGLWLVGLARCLAGIVANVVANARQRSSLRDGPGR